MMVSRNQKLLVYAAGGAVALIVGRRIWRNVFPRFRGQSVVITGGSRGLGLELARHWAAEGASVAICSRDPSDVEEAVGELRRDGRRVYGEACDVTNQDDVKQFIENVTHEFGRVDVLVNNAGIIQAGPVETMSMDDYRRALDTHFWGPLYAMDAVLPQMRSRRSGRIVNISSLGGKISVPHLVPYCASKFALAGLSEGLRTELVSSGIVVTTVCPGLMRTGSPRNAEFHGNTRAEYAWFSIASSMPLASIPSRRAARRIIRACRRGAPEVTLSLTGEVALRLHGLFRGMSLRLLQMANRFLPVAPPGGNDAAFGWQSFSRWSPSWLTFLNERAARRNREIRSPIARRPRPSRPTEVRPFSLQPYDEVDQAVADSFPASDPPSQTPVSGVGPMAGSEP